MTYFSHSSVAHWLVLLSLLLLTCKPENLLPDPTQSGQNTFGCLVNGKSYIPDGSGSWSGIKPVNGGFFVLRSIPYTLGVYVRTYAKDGQRIELYLNSYELGNHPLNSNTQTMPASLNPAKYGLYESGDGESYVTSSRYTGQITIVKADTVTGVVAGTFEFKAATAGGKTITVTNGRFDVNYRTQ